MAGACGLPTTLHAAQGFILRYPSKSMVLGMLHKQITSELGTSEITVKAHREGISGFCGGVPEAPLLDEMGKLLDLLLFTPERSLCFD
jgi:hypothetical protein